MIVNRSGVALSRCDFLFSILFPCVIYSAFVSVGREVFVYPEMTRALVFSLVIMIVLMLFALSGVSAGFAVFFKFVYRFVPWLGPRFFIVFSVFYLGLSTFYFLGDLNYIRYGAAASEQLDNTLTATAIFLCKIIVCTQVFYMLLMGVGLRLYSGFYWLCVSVSMILSTDGMAHVVLLGVFLWFLFGRESLDNFIYSSMFYKLGVKIAFGFGVVLLFFAGIAFKSKSIEAAVEILYDGESVKNNFLWLADRVSTLYFSMGYAINNSEFDFSLQIESWAVVFSEIKYRFCLVFSGSNCSDYKEFYGSISRLNFSNISVVDPGRGGASPGVLGAASYLFPLYMAPLFAFIYYALVSGAIAAAVGRSQKSTVKIFGAVVLIYLVRIMYLNPASMLNPISSPFIGAVVFFIISAQFCKLKRGFSDHE